MDTYVLDAPTGQQVADRPTLPTRRRRGPGRGTGPQARPDRRPAGAARRPRPAHACSVPPTRPLRARPTARWRLTDRGIAVVLATGLVIASAALVVVGLTALRVTGERYQPAHGRVLVQP